MEETIIFSSSVVQEWWSIAGDMNILMLFSILMFSSVIVAVMRINTNNAKRRLPPGPKPLPIIGNMHQLKGAMLHHKLGELASIYGPIMHLKVGPQPWVVASSADAAEEFLKVNDKAWAGRPHTIFVRMFTNNLRNISRAPYGPHWRHMRQICSRELFTTKRLESFRPRRTEEVDEMMRSLYRDAMEGGKVSALNAKAGQLAANNVMRMLLNRRLFGTDSEGQMQAFKFRSLIADLTKTASTRTLGDIYPWLRWVPYVTGSVNKMKQIKTGMNKILQDLLEVKKTKSDGTSTTVNGKDKHIVDFVDVLMLQPSEDGSGTLEDDIIRAVVQDMLIAGTDTSSSAVEWAISELIRNPECMEKLQGELDMVVGKDRVVSETDFPNLPYLQAVIKETFRLHPPVPLELPHMSREPTTIWGYDLPVNMQLFVNCYIIQRDPKYWPKPLEFKPERFIENPEIDMKGNHFQFIPFGAGRRQCPGMSLGLLIVQIGVARLAQGFNFALPGNQDPRDLDMTETLGVSMPRANPLLVIVTPRLGSHLY